MAVSTATPRPAESSSATLDLSSWQVASSESSSSFLLLQLVAGFHQPTGQDHGSPSGHQCAQLLGDLQPRLLDLVQCLASQVGDLPWGWTVPTDARPVQSCLPFGTLKIPRQTQYIPTPGVPRQMLKHQ